MKVIGTAGHIDHGKSTLVKRLTGIDPDRLDEEKRRGMTIDLGFAWIDLPSGERASIVDVPGHERFVHNMLAGAWGIDLALLVVAADESVMPQTREHAAILDLLGIAGGVVALTKADRVEDELIEIASEEVRELLQGSGLAASPIVAVDSVSGRGLDHLMEALDGALAVGKRRPDTGKIYLPIDRVFTRPGYGTVVTGTLHGGPLTTGDEISIVPGERRARVRGLQVHGKSVTTAPGGARVAVNLAGVPADSLHRGDALSVDGSLRGVQSFDARIQVLPSAPVTLRSGMDVTVHLGAAEGTATIRCLEGNIQPGGESWVHFRTRRPVPATRHMRYVVRLPSPVGTVGGGEVVDLSPRRGRRTTVVARLEQLGSDSLGEVILGILSSGRYDAGELARQAGEPDDLVAAALADLCETGPIVKIGGTYLADRSWGELRRRALDRLAEFHAGHPYRAGMPREELRNKLDWPEGTWNELLAVLLSEGTIEERGLAVALKSHDRAWQAGHAENLLSVLMKEPFRPPSGEELLARAGCDQELLAALTEQGQIVRVDDGLYFGRPAYEEVLAQVRAVIAAEGELTVARLRDDLDTSRKYALALLEYLDRRRITQRRGDARILGSRSA